MARITIILTVLTTVIALLGGFQWVLNEWRLWRNRRSKWEVLGLTLFMMLAAPSLGHPADITAASCSAAHVQSAINLAAQGDRVIIPSTSCTWNTSVRIPPTKGITLMGGGEGATVITDGGGQVSGDMVNNCTIYNQCGWGALLYVGFTNTNSAVTRVTGITFVTSTTVGASNYELFVQGNGLDKFRIDHVTCSGELARRCVSTYSDDKGATEFSGLVDHVTCDTNSVASPQCFNNTVANNEADMAWKWPVILGSNHATYWEDITCIYRNTVADSCFDNYDGASWVARFSTFTHIGVGNHGVDSAYRGGHLLEMYRNTFTTTVSLPNGMNWRTLPNILFDNTFSNLVGGTGINLSLYRSDPAQTANGNTGSPCNGANAFDGNLGTSTPGGDLGYPCLDQVGWFFPAPVGCTSQATCAVANGVNVQYAPAYMWLNTHTGAATRASTGGYPAAYAHINAATAPDKIDVYDDVSASCTGGGTCTVGIGIGTTLPTSCTTGVGFWKSNEGSWNQAVGTPGGQGVLYKCTATNTWTLYYTPYTYPHPLQQVGVVSPSGFRVAMRMVQLAELVLPVLGVSWHFRKAILAGSVAAVSMGAMAWDAIPDYSARVQYQAKVTAANAILAVVEKVKDRSWL